MQGITADPGGTPGVASPTSDRFDGATVVGLYAVVGDAVSTDSVHNAGGPFIVNANLELLFGATFG